MSVYDVVIRRRTIRKYEQKPVPREILDRLLDAGRLAPSGANLQPLEFIAVDDPQTCAQVFECLAWAGYLADGAPPAGMEPTAYIVILNNKQIREDPGQDPGIAAESMTLVAEDEGIGSCMIGSIKRGRLAQVLGIPDTHSIQLVLALGYPAETAVMDEMQGDDIRYWRDAQGVHHVPKRPKDKITHWNRYGTR